MPGKHVPRPVAVLGMTAAQATPAFAHPGAHHGMTWGELIAHLATPWHAIPLALVAAVGLFVVAIGRRLSAKAKLADHRVRRRS